MPGFTWGGVGDPDSCEWPGQPDGWGVIESDNPSGCGGDSNAMSSGRCSAMPARIGSSEASGVEPTYRSAPLRTTRVAPCCLRAWRMSQGVTDPPRTGLKCFLPKLQVQRQNGFRG